MDAEDQKDIINKVKKAGSTDTEPSTDTTNPEDLDVKVDAELEELDELTVYENLFLDKPKKNNMFQEGSNDILDESDESDETDRCTRIAKRKYDVWPSAYACVPENTSKALTRDGWKDVNQLNLGDEIMTYNIERDELEFKPILNLHRYKDVKTNVVRSGNNGFIFEATDNHKWVVKLPDIKGNRLQKYDRINDKALIETSDLLANKNNKSLVVSAPYNGGNNVKLDEIFKYGTNWVKYILDITSEQRQAWLFSAIVYDGNQQKVERLTENINKIDKLNWLHTGPHGKQSFGFKQKDIEHRDAFLLSAFLNSGLVTWKKAKDKDIYSCHYSSNKPLKNTSNFKLVKENISDVWCPETENGTWVMMQETEGRGIITITGNSGAVVRCRKGKIWKGIKEEDLDKLGDYKNMTDEQIDEAAKKTDFSKEKESGLHGWFSRRGGEGSSGWVDCNTCRDGKCKPCGRKDGKERSKERSKYPSCRPTPSACKTKGKGDSWGKKAANENKLSIYQQNQEEEESNNYMFWQNLKGIYDNATEILGMNEQEVDALIADGHQWAVEHVITSKDDVEEVYHFIEAALEGIVVNEGEHESNNYMFWSSLKTIQHASKELLEMDYNSVDALLNDGHGWALDHIATSNDDMEEVYHFLTNTLDAYDGDSEAGYEDEYGTVEDANLYEDEGEYDDKPLGKPMKGDVKKRKVYVKNKKGNVIKVNFGDPNMEIKRDDPERRKSFRARHKCSDAKDRTTPKYWSCKMWSSTPVSKIVGEDLENSTKNTTFNENYIRMKLQETFGQDAEPMTAPTIDPKVQPMVEPNTKPSPSRKNKPFLPMPNVQPRPKANGTK